MKMPVSKKSLCNTCIGNDYKTLSFIMWLPKDNTFYVTFWCGSYWKVNGLRTLYKFFRIRVTSCLRSLGTSLLMEYLELCSVIGERSKTSRTDNIFFRDISSYSLHGCTYKCWGFNRSPRLMSTTTSSMTSTAVVCFRHKQTDSFWNK